VGEALEHVLHVELGGQQAGDDFAPGQGGRHRGSLVGADDVGRRDGLTLRDLHPVEIDFAALALGDGAGRCEEIGALGGQ